MSFRIGQGFDVHAFGGNGPIILGGVEIDHDQGLLAHSDGDVLVHSICDALLGAVAMGDIGQHFSDQDPKYKNADSMALLQEVVFMVAKAGYKIENVDSTIAAQSPKMAPHINSMRAKIAKTLGVNIDRVGVKATTTEKLGFVGRKEGIATMAVVLLSPLKRQSD